MIDLKAFFAPSSPFFLIPLLHTVFWLDLAIAVIVTYDEWHRLGNITFN